MFEEYPSIEESRTLEADGEVDILRGKTLEMEVRDSNDPNKIYDEEGPFNTIAYYNAVGSLIYGIEFVELLEFPRTATYTPPKGDEPESGNFYQRGKMIYDMIYGSQEINNIPASYTLKEDEAEDLGQMNEAVATLFESIKRFFAGDEDLPSRGNQFKTLAEKITIRDIKSLKGKREIYDYWATYYKNFNEQKPIPISLSDEEVKSFNSAFSKVKLPCIVIKHTDADFEQAGGNYGLLKMASQILLISMGMTPSKEFEEVFGKDFQQGGDVNRDEFGRETGTVGWVDENAKDNEAEIEMISNSLDPLTFLNLLERDAIYLAPEGEIISDLKTKIQTFLPKELSDLNPTSLDYLSSAVEDAIDDYVSLVDNKESYFLPMLDNHASEMSRVPIAGGFTFSYYKVEIIKIPDKQEGSQAFGDIDFEEVNRKLQLQEKLSGMEMGENTHLINFTLTQEPIETSYSMLMDKINSEMIGLLQTINRTVVEGRKKKFVQNIPKGGTTGSGQSAALGARYPSMPGSLSAIRENNFGPFLEFVYKMFITDVDYRYFFNRDYPSYIKSGAFVSFKSAYGAAKKKKGSVLSQQVAKYPFTAVDLSELESLNSLFSRLRKGATADIRGLIKQSENSVQAFLLMNLSLGATRADRTTLENEITESLGRIIYEFAAMQNLERATQLTFSGKQIQEYANAEIKDEHINILPELENEDFLESLSDEETSIVGSIKRKITGNFLRDILNTGDSDDIENSLLKAVDIMRRTNGLSVYRAHLDLANIDDVHTVSDLIRKEDRVDLYVKDMETILNSQNKSFDELSVQLGVSKNVIYKVRGLFR